MKRKEFLQTGLATGALMGTSTFASAYDQVETNDLNDQRKKVPWGYHVEYEEVRIEKPREGKPHKGKVLMAIQPHSDDIPLSAGGLVAKLMDEGYTGYLCSVSDDARGAGSYEQNRKDNLRIAEFYGMKDSFELLMPHHQMGSIGIQDLIQRFIFLFRAMRVDTIVCMDPWGHYEENPDHYVTGRAVEAARWIAETGIVLLGMDMPTPSLDEMAETHHVLLGHDIVVVEGLTNLHELPTEFLYIGFPLNLTGRDGSPIRAVAVISE